MAYLDDNGTVTGYREQHEERIKYEDVSPRRTRLSNVLHLASSPLALVLAVAIFAMTIGLVIVASILLQYIASVWIAAFAYTMLAVTAAAPVLVVSFGFVLLIRMIRKPHYKAVDAIGTIVTNPNGGVMLVAPSELWAVEQKDAIRTPYPTTVTSDDTISETKAIDGPTYYSSPLATYAPVATNDSEQAIINERKEAAERAETAEMKAIKLRIKQMIALNLGPTVISVAVNIKGRKYQNEFLPLYNQVLAEYISERGSESE